MSIYTYDLISWRNTSKIAKNSNKYQEFRKEQRSNNNNEVTTRTAEQARG